MLMRNKPFNIVNSSWSRPRATELIVSNYNAERMLGAVKTSDIPRPSGPSVLPPSFHQGMLPCCFMRSPGHVNGILRVQLCAYPSGISAVLAELNCLFLLSAPLSWEPTICSYEKRCLSNPLALSVNPVTTTLNLCTEGQTEGLKPFLREKVIVTRLRR